ncbi:MAG: riboflavin synthase [Planctomycetota bacterium]
MFTGLIQSMGTIIESRETAAGRSLVVNPGAFDHVPSHGASIAVNGCCLTVVAVDSDSAGGSRWQFDVIGQTLDVTSLGRLDVGSRVNLETAVTPTTMLGGHIVQGHVDGLIRVIAVQDDEHDWRIRFAAPADLLDMIIEHGSVALDGVSLTVASLFDDGFDVALIPETRAATTLGALSRDDVVNIEVDYVAKTVVHWLRRRHMPSTPTAT